MLGANLHFGSCPEDKILNMLQAAIQSLQEVLHSERISSTEAPGSAFTKASGHPLGHGDSASALKKVLCLFKEWSVLHTQKTGCLREALTTTVHTLIEQDRNANHGHMVPKREIQAKQLGKLRWSKMSHYCLFCMQFYFVYFYSVTWQDKKICDRFPSRSLPRR